MTPHDGHAQEVAPAILRDLLPPALPHIEQLVRRHFRRSLRDRESVSDVVDSVCADLLQDGIVFEYRSPAQFHGWLRTVVLHKIRARLRHNSTIKRDTRKLVPFTESEHGAANSDLASPSQMSHLKEHLGLLDRAMAALPDHYREVIVRRHLRGHSRAQIAADLRMTLPAIQNLIARAKARLAGTMDGILRGDR